MFSLKHFLKNTIKTLFGLFVIYAFMSILWFFKTYSTDLNREFETYILNNSNIKIEIIDEGINETLEPGKYTIIKGEEYLKKDFKIIKNDIVLYTGDKIYKNDKYSTITEKKYTLFDEKNEEYVKVLENKKVFYNGTDIFKENNYNITFEKKYWILPMFSGRKKTIIQKRVEIK